MAQRKPERTGIDAPSMVTTLSNISEIEAQKQTQTTGRDQMDPKARHPISPRIISDAILGLSDGLTVPFALTAGLSALGTTRLVVLGGLAELMAGAISMGLGGFVGAKSEAESYHATERVCETLIRSSPYQTTRIIQDHFQQYRLSDASVEVINRNLHSSPAALKDFLMAHHFGVAEPTGGRPYVSALTLGLSYIIGGIIPLIPYFGVDEVLTGLWISVGLMAVVLLVFGYVKTCLVRGWRGAENVVAGLKGSVQMLVVGAVAAGAAVGLVRAVNSAGTLR